MYVKLLNYFFIQLRGKYVDDFNLIIFTVQ